MSAYVTEDPFLRLTVGVPVYTSDEQRIGSVKEKRSRHFKVETGWFRRDFWLPAECVDSVVAGEPVVLNIDSGRLNDRKVADPDEAAA